MDNEKETLTDLTPELSLDLVDVEAAPVLPTLTLDDPETAEALGLKVIDNLPALKEIEALPERNLEENLTPEELKMVEEFSKKIDVTNSTHILQYGAASQKKMVAFSETTLSAVKGKDLGNVGEMITGLVVELKDFDPSKEEKGGFFGLFKKPKKKLDQIQADFASVEANVDKIVGQLEQHKITLLKDITMLDRMYDMNLAYYKELTLYILAGKKKLKTVEEVDLPEMRRKAEESGQAQDAQAANDFAAMANRFDKKLHDLELTRNISIQMGPQIRLVQNNDAMMVEKIQSSIVNTIPLWKNQMVLTLGLAHSAQAIEAQRMVTDTTNQLLKENADKLKTSTIEAAKESERGIVDIETLQYTNQSLIATLDEVLAIQQEGYQKRRSAEGELQRIENELKAKLLEVRDASQMPPSAPDTATTPQAELEAALAETADDTQGPPELTL